MDKLEFFPSYNIQEFAKYNFYIYSANWNFPTYECNAIFHVWQLIEIFRADNCWQNWIFTAGIMKQWLQISMLIFAQIFSSNLNLMSLHWFGWYAQIEKPLPGWYLIFMIFVTIGSIWSKDPRTCPSWKDLWNFGYLLYIIPEGQLI